jgi:hypothetical protein
MKNTTIGYIATFKTKEKTDTNSVRVSFQTIISENKKDCTKFKNKKDFSIVEIKIGDHSYIATSIDTIDISEEEILEVWEHRYPTLQDKSITSEFYFTHQKLGMWAFDNYQKINMQEVKIEFLQIQFPMMTKEEIIKQIENIEDFEIAIYENELASF